MAFYPSLATPYTFERIPKVRKIKPNLPMLGGVIKRG